jgi:Dolichyl-phosphate-mannose-protein mannosyltransferase
MALSGWPRLFGQGIVRARARYLLLAAAVLHLALTITIALAGRFALLSSLFDENGISGAFAFDSFLYRRKSVELVDALMRGSFSDWFYAPLPLHVKIYSLSFAVLSPLFGFTMLSVEPLNLLYYLLILVLVYKLCAEVFERRVALLAATAIALWPSFLLHTTQLLRDPLFIVAMLLLLLVITRWLLREHTLRRGLAEGLAAAGASAVVWLTRYNMWTVIIGITLVGVTFLIVRQWRSKVWLVGNIAGALVLLVALALVPSVVGRFLQPDSFFSPNQAALRVLPSTFVPCPDEGRSGEQTSLQQPQGAWSRLRARADGAVASLSKLRRRFITSYFDAGSNIDPCVKLETVGDLLRFLPRATANGFFAPYPDMWLKSGSSVGLSGRLLSGVETLLMYLIELLAIFGLWTGRRRLPVWLIALSAVGGIISLGLVVVNVAVLFRLRYFFLMLLIVLAAGGVRQILSLRNSKRSDTDTAIAG